MTQNKKDQWLKKFDMLFCNPLCICPKIVGRGHLNLHRTECPYQQGVGISEYGKDTIKSFLSSLLDDIDQDWKKRILEAVGEEIKADCSYDSGFNSCRSQILEKLNLKEK